MHTSAPSSLPPTAIERHLEATRRRFRNHRSFVSELAEASGVPEPTVRRMVRGDWKPRSIENLIKVERALDKLESAPEPVGADGEVT
ncbi:helix-turn-helix domain-containing protein [Hyphobacterium sp.]|uniref:helix-turn-helix domain-containing protein n=1 Tax=Hyphobacterium sp. TaxID=2004662 RepID=UPI003B52310E